MTMASGVLEVRRLEQASEWLLRLREDALGDEEMQQWLDWCEADPANLEAFEHIQALWRGVPKQSAPVQLAPPVAVNRPLRWRPARWKVMTAAAALVAAIGAGLFYERITRLELMTVSTLEAPPRANRNSLLPDGSQLDLAAGSAVTVDYAYNKRHLSMRDGMAFFQVARDRSRPFVVEAGPVSITALGTAFNVRRHDRRFIVTVTEGAVKIGQDNGRELRAEAGYQLLYDATTRETLLRPVDPAAELGWREGRLVYDGEPLDTVVEIVNRYSSKQIVLGDAKLRRIRYTGTVFTDSIETWLGALPRAFPVAVDDEDGRVTLTTR